MIRKGRRARMTDVYTTLHRGLQATGKFSRVYGRMQAVKPAARERAARGSESAGRPLWLTRPVLAGQDCRYELAEICGRCRAAAVEVGAAAVRAIDVQYAVY